MLLKDHLTEKQIYDLNRAKSKIKMRLLSIAEQPQFLFYSESLSLLSSSPAVMSDSPLLSELSSSLPESEPESESEGS